MKNLKNKIKDLFQKRKKLVYLGVFILFVVFLYANKITKKTSGTVTQAKSVFAEINKSFEFNALNSQGKEVKDKIQLKITNIEKTNQVYVQDKPFTARNEKLFLIVNLELKNDATQPLNIIPGDLVRLSIADNNDAKFAPDLHNNMVSVSAISTKIDRVGFVIPDTAKSFKLYVGEIEGKKEEIQISFAS